MSGRLQTYSKLETGEPTLDRVQDRLMQVINPALKNELLSTGVDERRCIAIYHSSAIQSIPNVTYTIINFDVSEEDSDRAVSTGQAWVFTVPNDKAGLYCISAGVALTNAASVYRIILDVFRNAAAFRRLFDGPSLTSGGDTGPFGSCLVRLNAGERISLALYQGSGGSINTSVPAPIGVSTRIEICRLTGA